MPFFLFHNSATGLSGSFKGTGHFNCYNAAAIPSTVFISVCNQQRIFFTFYAPDLCIRVRSCLLV